MLNVTIDTSSSMPWLGLIVNVRPVKSKAFARLSTEIVYELDPQDAS